ncbi:endoribonuclease l-psp [Trichoderma arundinaceum]|uniref:Endoribonuclease l-psp n=1 Tax=Trichoderma arundinaceum TaxID=490622 RepID=A0A395NJ50_TRIAR|nr:endoribonuclease l-psp [Trichoderma arundinaceum]
MSLKKVGVFTDDAPTLRPGVYTPAIIANGFVFTSGVLGADPTTKKIVSGTVIDRFVRYLNLFSLSLAQAHCIAQHQIMRNLDAILKQANSGLESVVEVTVFLTNILDADELSLAYKTYWGDLKPARTCVAVKELPYGSDIELKCIAVVVGS